MAHYSPMIAGTTMKSPSRAGALARASSASVTSTSCWLTAGPPTVLHVLHDSARRDGLFHGLGPGEPADGDNQNEADGGKGDNERRHRIGRGAAWAVAANAGNLRHFGFQVGGGLIFSHSAGGSFGTRVVLEGNWD